MKVWQCKEFTSEIDGLGLGIIRERTAREVCDFLDEKNLAPTSVKITTHVELDERRAKQIAVTQVFYRQ